MLNAFLVTIGRFFEVSQGSYERLPTVIRLCGLGLKNHRDQSCSIYLWTFLILLPYQISASVDILGGQTKTSLSRPLLK